MSEAAKSNFRKWVGYQGGLVGGIALLASAILILGHENTKEAIAQNIDADTRKILSELLPESLYDNDLLQDKLHLTHQEITTLTAPLDVYRASKNGEVTALVYKVAEPGYSGTITSMLAIDRDGKVLNVRVLSHTETPGLGDKIEAKRNPWIFAFSGKSLADPSEEQWKVKKDGGIYDQFTGATITPRAVVLSIKKGLLFFKEHREMLLTPATAAAGAAAPPSAATAEEPKS